MKWTNSYRSFGLKTKRSTGLKTIEHKHTERETIMATRKRRTKGAGSIILGKDGQPRKAGVWGGEQSYLVDKVKEWKSGHARRRIDALVALLPFLRESGSVHIDAFGLIGKNEELRQTVYGIFDYWRGMGIDVGRVFSRTFALGSALAGLGGALGVEMLGLDPEFPVKYLVYFLIVVSVGGSGNILGSLYAAILLGVADVVGKYYIPQIGAFIIYAVMVATLIFRPHGLFGRAHK